MTRYIALTLTATVLSACNSLPDEVQGFASRCLEMTTGPIPPHTDDPHDGFKRVYACNISPEQRSALQNADITRFPDGALIVKASRRDGEDFDWLVATAEKVGQTWRWTEYTRNFPGEQLLEIPSGPQVCIDCHRAASDRDWIFTTFGQR